MNIFNLEPLYITKIISAEKYYFKKDEIRICGYNRSDYVTPFYTLFMVTDGIIKIENPINSFIVKNDYILFLDKYTPFVQTALTDIEGYLFNFVAPSGLIDRPNYTKVNNVEHYLSIFKEGAIMFSNRRAGYEMMATSSLMKILGTLKYDFYNNTERHSATDKLAFSFDYIKEHMFDYDFSVEKLSAVLGVSSTYLRRIFVQNIGIPPIKYIKKQRLSRAAEIISTQNRSISEVAKISGYTDTSYFCRDFKKFFGVSPAKYMPKVTFKDKNESNM